MKTRNRRSPIPPALSSPLLFAVALMVSCGAPGDSPDAGDSTGAFQPVPVLDAAASSLGSVAFPVSCGDEAAAHMRLGLALVHNMTYTAAESEFAAAAEADPGCALAYWGMAMTYLHPLWPDVPTDDQLTAGWGLLQQARSEGRPDEREEAYIAALEAYYRDADSRTETQRLQAYSAAWTEVTESVPEDPEAALFRALSMIARAGGSPDPLAVKAEAGSIAEGVLERIPDHPGAHHYAIHAFDEPSLSARALPVARSYDDVSPENSHALHMTSHIFTREGMWDESIEFNERAAAVALAEPVDGRTSHHHLHALDYLAYAHLQRGADDEAAEVLDHLRTLTGPVVNHAGSGYAFAAVPARIALEQRRWADAAALPVREPGTIPWDEYPHLEAIPVFARALGAARTGDLSAARMGTDRLATLRSGAAALPGVYDWGTQVQVQETAIRAWIALADGRPEEAEALMREAAELEATTTKNPVTPGEVLPAGEMLGDLLSELGKWDEASAAYEAALERNRNRFHSLLGAARAFEGAGDEAKAASFYSRLLEAAGTSPTRGSALEEARRYLANR